MKIQDNLILIIEDDYKIIELLELHLKDNGFKTETATNGKLAASKINKIDYSLIILDIMLPFIDGFQICKIIRQKNKLVPILMLTALADENDKVKALEMGADDYLVKPFGIRELIARIKALIRRAPLLNPEIKSEIKGSLQHGPLVLDLDKRKGRSYDKDFELTTTEFELLLLFMNNPGKAYSRSELLSIVWGYGFEGYEHTVNTHINRLRSKIETDSTKPELIKTVWGYGYKLEEVNTL